jgi:hypothetical protein
MDPLKSAPPRARRWFMRKRVWCLVIVALLFASMFSLSPDTQRLPPPTAAQVHDAQETFERVKSTTGITAPTQIAIPWDKMTHSVHLAAQLMGIDRALFSRKEGGLSLQTSVPVGAGLYLNIKGQATPRGDGFPTLTGKIGRLPVPNFIFRFAMRLGRWVLARRGIALPPPEAMIQKLELRDYGVFATLKIPKDSHLYAALNQSRGRTVDPSQTLTVYCALAKAARDQPSTDFTEHLRRAFSGRILADTGADANRARFVALGMLIVSRDVGRLAGDIDSKALACAAPRPETLLLGRTDLPKHWVLSAIMTAVLGTDLSLTMGTWKEVSDSGPGGSGFSFVDLAADRSGIYFGRLATADESANAAGAAVSRATEGLILPPNVLALMEGMTENQFRARFGNQSSTRYQAMVARIDTLLSKTR